MTEDGHVFRPIVFGSPTNRVTGMLHLPDPQAAVDVGVVLCAPLGRDDLQSHRPLRWLALALADAGRPTIRFDWPSFGDSAGQPDDEGLVEQWLDTVVAAVELLRHEIGVSSVSLVGVDVGALLAGVAARSVPAVSELVLWAPSRSGRAYLRQQRAFHVFAQASLGSVSSTGREVADDEIAGFAFSRETQDDVLGLDLMRHEGADHVPARALLIGRDGEAPDGSLAEHLTSLGTAVETATGEGLDVLLNDTTMLPQGTFDRILAWLGPGRGCTLRDLAPTSAELTIRHRGREVREATVVLENSGGRLVGVTTAPAGHEVGRTWVVFMSTGAVRRSGPHRMWTKLARDLAADGLASLRLDAWGVGDSDGPHVSTTTLGTLYADEVTASYSTAVEWLRDVHGADRFVLIGLCSGSTFAFQTAVARPDVSLGVLINLPMFEWDPEFEARLVLAAIRGSAFDLASWRRVFSGGMDLRQALRILGGSVRRGLLRRMPGHAETHERTIDPAAAVDALAARGGRLVLVYWEEDPALVEIEAQFPGGVAALEAHDGVGIHRVPGAGHTFMPLWAQRRLAAIVTETVETSGSLSDGGVDTRSAEAWA